MDIVFFLIFRFIFSTKTHIFQYLTGFYYWFTCFLYFRKSVNGSVLRWFFYLNKTGILIGKIFKSCDTKSFTSAYVAYLLNLHKPKTTWNSSKFKSIQINPQRLLVCFISHTYAQCEKKVLNSVKSYVMRKNGNHGKCWNQKLLNHHWITSDTNL